MTVRSVLPYSLRVLTRQENIDRAAGILTAHLEGDMTGWSRWTVPSQPEREPLRYEQQVVLTLALLRRLGPLTRPLFALNHAVMMRAGERGLRQHLGVR